MRGSNAMGFDGRPLMRLYCVGTNLNVQRILTQVGAAWFRDDLRTCGAHHKIRARPAVGKWRFAVIPSPCCHLRDRSDADSIPKHR